MLPLWVGRIMAKDCIPTVVFGAVTQKARIVLLKVWFLVWLRCSRSLVCNLLLSIEVDRSVMKLTYQPRLGKLM